MNLRGIGGDVPGLTSPITGADLTTGYSPSTMHNDPYTGLPIGQSPVVVIAPASAPASSGVPWLLLLALAGIAWYGYKQGWFEGLFGDNKVQEVEKWIR